MKILITASGDFTSTYGGGQTYVQRLVAALSKWDGMEVCVLFFVAGGAGNLAGLIHDGRVAVYTVDPGISSETLGLLLRELMPDVIHANGQKALMCRVARNVNIPCVVTAHHGGILCPGGTLLNAKDEICYKETAHRRCLKCCLRNIRCGDLLYPILRFLPRTMYLAMGRAIKKLPFMYFITPLGGVALDMEYKKQEWVRICRDCSAVIAPSHAIRIAMENNGMPAEKIIVLPHGVPMPPQAPTYVLEGKLKFFYVGRMCYVKGVHVLLKAFHAVKNENIELHLIGGAGNKRERIYMEQLQRKYAVDTRVIWHGKIPADEVNAMIAEYHVLVHPAICMEIFGLAIAEALSMGKWVLATRCGGAEMQVNDGKNGWLIPVNDSVALRRKIEEIALCPPTASPVILNYRTISEYTKSLLIILNKFNAEKRN